MKIRKRIDRVMGMFMAIVMTYATIALIFADNNVEASVYNARYQVVYDKFEELGRTPPMTPSEVYDKYGDMNGDYYVIAMEENYLYMTGRTDVGFRDLLFINESLQKDGTLPVNLRKGLREDVETYGLDCPLPDDPDFLVEENDMPTPTRNPSTSSEAVPDDGTDGSLGSVMEHNPGYDPAGMSTPVPAETYPTTEEQQYADVSSDAWYYEAVTAMSKGGLFKGYDDGLFHPNDNITYGQWATLMSRIAIDNYSYEMKPGDHWAQEAYHRAGMDGLITRIMGVSDETLDSLYYRGQAIASAYCLANGDKRGLGDRLKTNYTGRTWTFDNIPDGELIQRRYVRAIGEPHGNISSYGVGIWNDQHVLAAYNLGITHGVDADGTCNPTAPITRAEVAQLLYNMGIYYEKQCDLRVGGIGS